MAKKKQIPQNDLVDKGDGRYLLKGVRLSYAYLHTPDEQENDDGKKTKSYRVALLLPKDSGERTYKKLLRVITDLIAEEYDGGKVPKDRWFLRDGDEGDSEEHEGHWVISVRESRRPTLVDRNREPVMEEDEVIFSGVWANVVIRPWAQNGKSSKKKNKYGKRINCGFDIVQQIMKDEPLGGALRPDVDDVLDELDDDFGDNDDGDEDDRPTRRKASKPSTKKPTRRSRDEDEDEEEEEEEEERPARRSKTSKKPTRRSRDEDEDEDEDEEDLGF